MDHVRPGLHQFLGHQGGLIDVPPVSGHLGTADTENQGEVLPADLFDPPDNLHREADPALPVPAVPVGTGVVIGGHKLGYLVGVPAMDFHRVHTVIHTPLRAGGVTFHQLVDKIVVIFRNGLDLCAAARLDFGGVKLTEQLRAAAMYHVRRFLPAGHKLLVGNGGTAAAGLAVGAAAHCHRRRATGSPGPDKGKHLIIDAAVLAGEKSADRGENNAVFQFKIPNLEGGQDNRYAHNMISFSDDGSPAPFENSAGQVISQVFCASPPS